MTDYIFNPLPLMRMEVHSGVVSLILLYIVHLVFNYDERQLNSAVFVLFLNMEKVAISLLIAQQSQNKIFIKKGSIRGLITNISLL